MRPRSVLLAVAGALMFLAVLGLCWAALRPAAAERAPSPAPITVPAPSLNPGPSVTPTYETPPPTDVVPPPPIDDDDDDD